MAVLGIRLANPDLWQPWFGGEKPMEVAFLNAILKSAYMPPYDPYFAGGTVNYYYYGQYLMGYLMRLAGVPAEVGFNLAVPTLFSMLISHAYVLGYHLGGERSRALAGAASVALVAVMGNLTTPVQILNGLAQVGGATGLDPSHHPWGEWRTVGAGFSLVLRGDASLPGLDYWYASTRVIPGTINEFPFFTYLFADLHPHMIAIPFTLLVLVLLWAVAGGSCVGRWTRLAQYALLALSLGALGPMNTWDLPASAGLTALALTADGARRSGARGMWRGILTALAVIAVAMLFYLPFYQHFSGPDAGIALVDASDRSPTGAFTTVWGTQAFLSVTMLGLALCGTRSPLRQMAVLARKYGARRSLRRLRCLCPRATRGGVVGALTLAVGIVGATVLAVAGERLLAALAVLLAASLAALATARTPAETGQRALLAVGIGVILGTEIFYLRDFLDGTDWFRMNTVFKFQTQAWVLLAVALGSALPAMWEQLVRRRSALRGLWSAAAIVLVGSGLSYALWATPQRVSERFPGVPAPAGTLDGTAFMADAVYYWPGADNAIEMAWELEALQWLWENVRGTPIIAQADLGYYREGGLMLTSFSGLPTIVGMHASEQRPVEEVGARQRDVCLLYSTEDVSVAWDILERYSVSFIVVGQLERAIYPKEGLAKFGSMEASGALERAFQNEGITIYRVPD